MTGTLVYLQYQFINITILKHFGLCLILDLILQCSAEMRSGATVQNNQMNYLNKYLAIFFDCIYCINIYIYI